MKKNILLLFFVTTCSQYINADITIYSNDELKEILADDKSPLSPYQKEKILWTSKIKSLEAAQKEVAYFGSDQPTITNTRLGYMGALIGAIIGLVGTCQKDTKLAAVGAAIGTSGLAISLCSGTSSAEDLKESIKHCQVIEKSIDELAKK